MVLVAVRVVVLVAQVVAIVLAVPVVLPVVVVVPTVLGVPVVLVLLVVQEDPPPHSRNTSCSKYIGWLSSSDYWFRSLLVRWDFLECLGRLPRASSG